MGRVQQSFTVDVDAPPERVFPLLADLRHYEDLLDIVHRVSPETDTEREPAWIITLRAKLGPFARSKRLRMERVSHLPPKAVRFERRELDDRNHSTWTLDATVDPLSVDADVDENGGGDRGSRVTMTLDYGGGLWTGALGGVLEGQVAKAEENLRILANSA